MKKCVCGLVMSLLLAALCVSTSAQSPGASKATASVGKVAVMFPTASNTASTSAFTTAFSAGVTNQNNAFNSSTNSSVIATAWSPILTASFKPPGGQDLFITYSGIDGLFTTALTSTQNQAFVTNSGFTSASTAGGTGSTGAGAFSQANLRIELRVLIDSSPTDINTPPATGSVADPGPIMLDNLMRVIGLNSGLTLTGSNAVSAFATSSTNITESDLLQLLLAEGGARSFTFIKKDVGVGTHTITVQARYAANNFDSATAGAFATAFVSGTAGTAFSSVAADATAVATSQIAALIGPRTLTVEEVMLK